MDLRPKFVSILASVSVCRNRFLQSRMASILLKHARSAYRADVLQIYGLSYWRRLWVVQEVLLAKDIYLIFGKRTINWKSLYRLFTIQALVTSENGVIDSNHALFTLQQDRQKGYQHTGHPGGFELSSLLRTYG